MRIAWEEPFGPVVPILRVDSVQQAVDHCNANNLALQVAGASRLQGPGFRESRVQRSGFRI